MCVLFQANGNYIGNSFEVQEISVWSESQRSIFDELVNQAKKALEAVKKLITDNITGPMGDIGSLKEKLTKIVNDLVAQLKSKYEGQVQKITGDVMKVIDCYKAEAEKLGINIKTCYETSQAEIVALPQGKIY